MKKLIFLLPVMCLMIGCIGLGNNTKSSFNETQNLKNDRKDSDLLALSGNVMTRTPQAVTIEVAVGDNCSGNIIIPVTVQPEPQLFAAQGNIMETNKSEQSLKKDQRIAEAKESFDPMSYIYYGVGFLLILLAIFIAYRYLKNVFSMVGGDIALNNVIEHISIKRKNNLDPTRDAFLREMEMEMHEKVNSLNKKRRGQK